MQTSEACCLQSVLVCHSLAGNTTSSGELCARTCPLGLLLTIIGTRQIHELKTTEDQMSSCQCIQDGSSSAVIPTWPKHEVCHTEPWQPAETSCTVEEYYDLIKCKEAAHSNGQSPSKSCAKGDMLRKETVLKRSTVHCFHLRPYRDEHSASRPIRADKHRRGQRVLTWVTSREHCAAAG